MVISTVSFANNPPAQQPQAAQPKQENRYTLTWQAIGLIAATAFLVCVAMKAFFSGAIFYGIVSTLMTAAATLALRHIYQLSENANLIGSMKTEVKTFKEENEKLAKEVKTIQAENQQLGTHNKNLGANVGQLKIQMTEQATEHREFVQKSLEALAKQTQEGATSTALQAALTKTLSKQVLAAQNEHRTALRDAEAKLQITHALLSQKESELNQRTDELREVNEQIQANTRTLTNSVQAAERHIALTSGAPASGKHSTSAAFGSSVNVV
jgi:uncharacterized protein (DUF3084 family)